MSRTTPPRVVSTDEAGTVIATFVPSIVRDEKGGERTRVDILRPETGARGWLQTVLDVFLPAGYPHSVTDDYLEYQIYDSLQAFTSSIAGLLSSRAVLESTGFNDPTATTTSAVLLSILQESLGRVTTILFAHRLGTSLEPECKRYRLLADVLNDGAMVLECASPLLPTRAARVAVLSTAAAGKALCGVAAGASKASLSARFARAANIAEVNAKDASQETVISLLGMWAGSFVVSHVRGRAATWAALLSLLACHLLLNYRAVRAVRMVSLNRQRAGIVFGQYAAHGKVMAPEDVRRRERVFERDGVIRNAEGKVLGHASIGISFEQYLSVTGRSRLHTSFTLPEGTPEHGLLSKGGSTRRYLIHLDERSRHVFIALERSSSATDQLQAWLAAHRALHLSDEQRRAPHPTDELSASIVAEAVAYSDAEFATLADRLVDLGWDLDTAALETRRATRYSIVSQ